MKKFLKGLLLALGLVWGMGATSASAVDLITATITITNAPTVNGQTITVNGNTRTWTNSVQIAGSQILTNLTIGGSATNLFNQVANFPFSSPALVLGHSGSTGITLQSSPGGALAVTLSAGWGTVVLTTNTLTAAYAFRVPYTVEAAAQQTNIVSGAVAALDSNVTTNALHESAPAVQNLVGITNAQTVTGAKTFSSVTGQWKGMVSNSPAISGTVSALTNGVWTNPTLDHPITTNLVNYGGALRSPGSGLGSEQFGASAAALGANSIAVGAAAGATNAADSSVGNGALTSGEFASAFGAGALALADQGTGIGAGSTASGTNSTAVGAFAFSGYKNSTALGYLSLATAASQLRLGTSSEHVSIPGPLSAMGNCEVTFNRYAISSLANGNNLDLAVGTNTFIEVSGPTGAFAILGIAGGRDGKMVIILNQTGQNMTIACEGGAAGNDPTAANRIITMTGADRATTGNGAAWLIYNGNSSRWICLHVDP